MRLFIGRKQGSWNLQKLVFVVFFVCVSWFLCLVADEIEDASSKEKVKQHIANYSRMNTFPTMSSLPEEARAMLGSLMTDYLVYKKEYAKNIIFDPKASNLSEYLWNK